MNEIEIDEFGRSHPPQDADEIVTARGFLDYQRATLEWRCRGVDAAGLNVQVAASSMTLGGLLKHLSWAEDYWFSRRLRGNDPAPPWDAVDWDADNDWDWNSAAHDTPQELLDGWQQSVERSCALVDQALTEGGLDQLAQQPWPDGRSPSLRWILLHMVEEYSRHNGHADLLREAVDGVTGE